MKLGYDYQTFFRQRYGGISRYFTEVVHRLQANDECVVRVFAPHHSNAYLDDLPNLRGVGKSGGPYTGVSWHAYRWLNHVKTKREMRRWKPSIVHETYYDNRTTAPAKTPIVITVYDMIQEVFPQYLRSEEKTTLRKRIAVDRADKVIAISECTKNDLIRFFGVPEEKVVVSHLAAETIAKADRDPSPLVTEDPFILYVGKREGYKGFETLLKALAAGGQALNDLHVVAFGGGAFGAEEITSIKSKCLALNRFHQLGGSDAILANYYAEAYAFVIPSEYEGFGIPPLEAMNYGCPVLASTGGSIPEVVGEAALLFEPKDHNALAHQLEKVVEDEALRADLIARGLHQAEGFSWDRCAQEHLELYKETISDYGAK
jgi:glycosyltransferase involved in cell wall biosynthesis